MTRRPLFAANWKCFKTPDETRAYIDAFRPGAEELIPKTDIAILPPFIDLETVRLALDGTTIGYGAQDCYWEQQGAFTGEVSAAMLGALGCEYCIVGHSERRRLFGETDEMVSKKITALLAEGITPIVCVGETLDEYKGGLTLQRVMQQVSDGLGHLEDGERANLVVAYEPVWAIGTGLADDPDSANRTIGYIRQCLGGLDEARVLYGGSMKAENAAQFCAQPNIDGGLVGSASLDAVTFLKLVENGAEMRA
ncbi:MAG TPA: triose-phosphate isomerase [Candidatus Eremiobacteraceae bacterium]